MPRPKWILVRVTMVHAIQPREWEYSYNYPASSKQTQDTPNHDHEHGPWTRQLLYFVDVLFRLDSRRNCGHIQIFRSLRVKELEYAVQHSRGVRDSAPRLSLHAFDGVLPFGSVRVRKNLPHQYHCRTNGNVSGKAGVGYNTKRLWRRGQGAETVKQSLRDSGRPDIRTGCTKQKQKSFVSSLTVLRSRLSAVH